MGINISAWLIAAPKEQALSSMAAAFGFLAEKVGEDRWEVHETGYYNSVREEQRVMIYAKNGCTVLYGDLAPFGLFRFEDEEERLLKSFPKAAAFTGSETSMGFYFRFYGQDRTVGKDFYLFEEEFSHEGENILKLGEENDMIYDGFFPLLQSYLGETHADDPVEIYRLTPKPGVREAVAAVLAGNAHKRVEDGYQALLTLRTLQESARACVPGYYTLLAAAKKKEVKDLTAYVKSWLWKCARFWEMKTLSKEEKEVLATMRLQVTAVWAAENVQVQGEAFGRAYRETEDLISPQTEEDPYGKLHRLTELMKEMIRLGYLAPDNPDKYKTDEYREKTIEAMHDLAGQWRSGIFERPRNYSAQLRNMAMELAIAGVKIVRKPWWKFWGS